MYEILIYNQTKVRVPKKFIKDTISKTLNFLKLKQPVELAVLVVSPSEIKRLNKFWRNKNYIPDELSFGLNSRKIGEPACRQAGLAKEQNKMLELGEIVVNVDNIFNKKYLTTILVHGLLHLLGEHHENSRAKAEKMEKIEKKILKYLNIKFRN